MLQEKITWEGATGSHPTPSTAPPASRRTAPSSKQPWSFLPTGFPRTERRRGRSWQRRNCCWWRRVRRRRTGCGEKGSAGGWTGWWRERRRASRFWMTLWRHSHRSFRKRTPSLWYTVKIKKKCQIEKYKLCLYFFSLLKI